MYFFSKSISIFIQKRSDFQCSDYCATNLCLALLLLAIISIPNVFSALIDSVVRRIEQEVVAARVSKEEKRTQHRSAVTAVFSCWTILRTTTTRENYSNSIIVVHSHAARNLHSNSLLESVFKKRLRCWTKSLAPPNNARLSGTQKCKELRGQLLLLVLL